VNSATGRLTPVSGSPFANLNADTLAFSPSGRLLAVTDGNGNIDDVSMYSVNSATGRLTQVPGSPFHSSGSDPYSVAFSPSGRLLAVGNSDDGTVSVFSVNSATGRLTRVPGSPFSNGSESAGAEVAFSPSGGLLAVTDNWDNKLSIFSVNSSTGRLTRMLGSPYPMRESPAAPTFSPSGRLLAVTNIESNVVSVFSVNSATGRLTPVSGSPFATGGNPNSAAFSPSGGLLAVGNAESNTVSVFSVGAPRVSIASPSAGGTYAWWQSVPTRFSCTDAPYAPGISSCRQRGASGGSGHLDTATAGRHTYTVTATSRDGQSATKSITYTIAGPRLKAFSDGRFVVVAKVPGPGRVDVLITAWNNNLAHATRLLNPAPGRFVFARAKATATGTAGLRIPVYPNGKGRSLVQHHTYRITLRLWVTYTPKHGQSRSIGYYGLHLP
jgi:6-phosphogluconolactonase (cycloisomerase 2 family)